uniref:Peptidase S1 domain-containing protein n=1 Tax=Pseudictyota dubia TaxID=2749911 RepID=A0A7R9Z305_9STRA
MMCARADKRDACQGDSGGPLILHPEDNKWQSGDQRTDGRVGVGDDDDDHQRHVQTGVVSFGIGCALRYFPGVYSRISTQGRWIRDTVCDMTKDEGEGGAPEWFNCRGELGKKKDEEDSKKKVIGDAGGPPTPPAREPRTPRPTPMPTRRRRRGRKPPKGHKMNVGGGGNNAARNGQTAPVRMAPAPATAPVSAPAPTDLHIDEDEEPPLTLPGRREVPSVRFEQFDAQSHSTYKDYAADVIDESLASVQLPPGFGFDDLDADTAATAAQDARERLVANDDRHNYNHAWGAAEEEIGPDAREGIDDGDDGAAASASFSGGLFVVAEEEDDGGT